MNPALVSALAKFNLCAPIRRSLAVSSKVLDEKTGLVRYCASDETLDHEGEIVRVNGWRFSYFANNAPFVDSHDYSTIKNLLGQVVGYKIEGGELVEDVKYSLEPGTLAEWAFKLVRDGFLRAVSVGYIPLRRVSKWDGDPKDFMAQITDLKLDLATAAQLRCVSIEQEQIELSQCVLGMNPSALAKAYAAKTLSEHDLEKFSDMIASTKHAAPAADSADAGAASPRTRLAIMAAIQAHL